MPEQANRDGRGPGVEAADRDSAPGLPTVSVIMPIRNEADFIERSIGSILANDYPAEKLEVIVVDGMSSDGTRQIVARLAGDDPRVKVLDNPYRIVPHAMNAGIRIAKGQVLIRIDGHTLVEPNYISEAVRVLHEHPDACGAGGILETVATTYVGRAIAAAMSNPVGVGAGNCRVGRPREGFVYDVPFPAYWRWVYDKVGLLDETLVRNQDDDLVQRVNQAGLKHYACPTIRSRYYSRASLRKLARQFYEYGFWRIRTLQKHKSPGQLRRVGPMVFVLLWLALIVGGFFWWPLRWALAGYAGLYLLALIVGAVTAGRRFGWVLAPLVPVAIAIMHFAYGLGSLKGIWSWVILRGRFVPPPEAHGTTR